MDRTKFVQSIEIFKNFSTTTKNKLAEILEETDFPKDTVIFSEGDPAQHLYIIISGEVVITKKISPHAEKILSTLGPQKLFGETSLFVNFPRTATSKTKTETNCYKINREKFSSILSLDPEGATKTIEMFLFYNLERLEKTSKELATIYEISKIIIKNLSLKDFCYNVIKQISYSISDIDSIVLFLWNEFTMEFEPISFVGIQTDISLEKNTQLVKYISEYSETFLTDSKDIVEFIEKNFQITDCPKSNKYIISTLKKDLELSGFMLLFNRKKCVSYDSDICDLMNSVSNLLLGAIENIKMKEEEQARKRLDRTKQGTIIW